MAVDEWMANVVRVRRWWQQLVGESRPVPCPGPIANWCCDPCPCPCDLHLGVPVQQKNLNLHTSDRTAGRGCAPVHPSNPFKFSHSHIHTSPQSYVHTAFRSSRA